MNSCRTNIQPLCIRFIFTDIFFSAFFGRNAFFFGLFDNLVIDIGIILNEIDFVSTVFKESAQHIKNTNRSCIADMDIIIDRRATYIHIDLIRVHRLEFLFFVCQCIKNLNHNK